MLKQVDFKFSAIRNEFYPKTVILFTKTTFTLDCHVTKAIFYHNLTHSMWKITVKKSSHDLVSIN